jgi:hypothetical protein
MTAPERVLMERRLQTLEYLAGQTDDLGWLLDRSGLPQRFHPS